MAKKSPMLKELKVEFREALVKGGFALADADRAAQINVNTLRDIYGGDQPYIPKDDDRLEKRDWEIWEAFNGTNHAEIGKRFNLTERQVYNRLEKIRPIAIAREQGSLFEECVEG